MLLVEKVLDLDDNERAFIDELLGNGEYKVELLYPDDKEITERLRKHPAPLWKIKNVKRDK